MQDGQRRGIHQGRVPVRAGIEYRGYLWLRTWDFAGRLTAALEQDRTGGEIYASADLGSIAADGAWKQYPFTLRRGPILSPGSRSSSTAGAACGALRAKHGSPEPFAVKTWEIGNEIWWQSSAQAELDSI